MADFQVVTVAVRRGVCGLPLLVSFGIFLLYTLWAMLTVADATDTYLAIVYVLHRSTDPYQFLHHKGIVA